MTEAEWLAATDPASLLDFLCGKVSERKARRLVCAVIRSAPFADDGRTMWELARTYDWFEQKAWRYEIGEGGEVVQTQELVTISCHEAIEVAERYADATAARADLATAAFGAFAARYCAEADTFGYDPAVKPGYRYRYRIAQCFEYAAVSGDDLLARRTVSVLDYLDELDQPVSPSFLPATVSLIRDIFGNPFRPVAFSPEWRTDTAVTLARQMYESRDFSAMPILADALQGAGCDSEDVLNHCRDAHATHVRGCWVVDQVLGKE